MKSLQSRIALAALVVLIAPAASAQATTFNACYVPSIGAMYLINRPGLPTACLATAHVALTWTDGGVADGAVVTAKLADGSVTTIKLADLAVTTAKLADLGVTTAKLADLGVTAAKLADLSVTAGKHADLSVATGKLADLSVTAGKLADLSVSSGKIADLAVTTGKIADGSVTSAKLAADVAAGLLADGSVTIPKLAFDPATQVELDAYKTLLASAGTLNDAGNPIDYSRLKNAPTGGSGTITGVTAGDGLTGGGTTGAVTLALNLAGSGSELSAARSDHNHLVGVDNSVIGKDAFLANSSGTANSAHGHGALMLSTSGSSNVAVGYRTMIDNTSGSQNTAVGMNTFENNTTGNSNTAIGVSALGSSSLESQNTAVGAYALLNHTSGAWNVAIGDGAMITHTTGLGNTALGQASLNVLSTGENNVAVGRDAGVSLTSGSRNIYIGNAGQAVEDDKIRIGNTANGNMRTYIAGIRGATTINANGVAVLIDSDGQLGTISSSRRFKEDISDMGDTRALLGLRPVQFRYKQPTKDGSKPLQYGLIAEEVAELMPRLVDFDSTGTPRTVYYHTLPVLLLNEIQRQERELVGLRKSIAALEAAVAELRRERQ